MSGSVLKLDLDLGTLELTLYNKIKERFDRDIKSELISKLYEDLRPKYDDTKEEIDERLTNKINVAVDAAIDKIKYTDEDLTLEEFTNKSVKDIAKNQKLEYRERSSYSRGSAKQVNLDGYVNRKIVDRMEKYIEDRFFEFESEISKRVEDMFTAELAKTLNNIVSKTLGETGRYEDLAEKFKNE